MGKSLYQLQVMGFKVGSIGQCGVDVAQLSAGSSEPGLPVVCRLKSTSYANS
jgi:hypothetical protein